MKGSTHQSRRNSLQQKLDDVLTIGFHKLITLSKANTVYTSKTSALEPIPILHAEKQVALKDSEDEATPYWLKQLGPSLLHAYTIFPYTNEFDYMYNRC